MLHFPVFLADLSSQQATSDRWYVGLAHGGLWTGGSRGEAVFQQTVAGG